ncbi:PQQ-dependent sugar dehydrogenase [Neolewinella sp.]|uniref:PQQ-dependent sugar dehydrogenase n=1 Tax=Neolewinella sp. TaxID=2993543 RepID=UPI003B526119
MVLLLGTGELFAQPTLRLVELDTTFNQPVDITKAHDGTDEIYITERLGRVYRYSRTEEQTRLVLDLSHLVESKTLGGMLGLDFHPQFPDSSYFYVNYTAEANRPDVALVSRISRFTMGRNGVADLESEYVIMQLDQPGIYHNLGDIAFGPDGYLYVPSGDGSLENDEYRAGQDPTVRLGKLLRIDVNRPGDSLNYSIPADNPYVSSTDTLPEIWSMGLRNPRQLSFDRATGDLWIGDIGEFNYQEMNYQRVGNGGGQNYGWSCMEGFEPYPVQDTSCGSAKMYDPPRFVYPTTSDDGVNGAFIIGGYVYRGPEEELGGYFFFGDFLGSTLFAYSTEDSTGTIYNVTPETPVSNVSCFGESNDGSMFVASYNGQIFRMEGPDTTTAVGYRVKSPTLTVYPNPTTGGVRVDIPPSLHGPALLTVTTMAGREVLRQARTVQGEAGIDLMLSDLGPGIYVLRLATATAAATARLLLR